MMKNVLLLTACMSAAILASSQQHEHFIKYRNSTSRALVQSILSKQFNSSTALKPTGTHQRVIAQGITEIDGSDITLDSFIYKYSGSNNSRYDYNQIGYNETFELIYAPNHVDHRYDADPLNLLADSIINYYQDELYGIERAYYRADKKIDSVYGRYNTGLADRSNAIVAYNAAGNIQTIYTIEDYSGSGLDTYSVHKYYYNAANTQLLADTVTMEDAPGAYFGYKYIYNAASGRMDTSYSTYFSTTIDNRSRLIYDYYPDGKLRKATQQQFENNAWKTTGYDSLGYTAGVDYYTYWRQTAIFPDPGGDTELHFLTEQYPGANNSPDSTVQYQWDGDNSEWLPLVRYDYEYNSQGNPVKFIATSIESGSTDPLGHINFYYEDYDDGLSIKPVAENKDFNIYPNPFTNNINIDWKGKQQSNVSVRLTNMIGQEIFKTSLRLNSGANSISVPGLSVGNYILVIQDGNGKSWSTKMVKK